MMRTWADEVRSPKYSHVERERRFLVDLARIPPFDAGHVLVHDRYIRDTRLRLRRMTDSETGKIALKFAKKYETDDPLARPMVNAYLTEREYAILAELPADTLTKRRYNVLVDGVDFSIDVFQAELDGLVLSEIEVSDGATLTSLAMPAWAAAEVSHDPRFQGGALAQMSADDLAKLLRLL